MDHFIKVCKGFACLFNEKLITRQVLASCFSTKGKALGTIVKLIALEVDEVNCLAIGGMLRKL